MKLENRVGLMTASGAGIGRAIAVALAGAGVHVAVNYKEREAAASEAVEEIRATGCRAMAVQADVSRSGEVALMVAAVERELGPVQILVNNAGISRPQPLDSITEQDWNELIAVNLTSCFLVTQAVLPGMRALRWGRIINLSSVAAQTGGVVGPHYAASKAGMLGLTHSYAALLAKEGITANAIAPALVKTEMMSANPRATPALIPVGRFGHIQEVADAALMLARNAYITGQTINVNGGWYMS